jgi:hypothetical protein
MSDLKGEARFLISRHGHSRIFGTSNVVRKWAALLVSVALLAMCAYLMERNVREYLAYNVVTQSRQVELTTGPILFPAITLCPLREDPMAVVASLPLEHTLSACVLDSWPHRCRAHDFHSFPVWFPLHGQHLTCYKLNGGRDHFGSHIRPLFTSTNWGYESGLTLAFRLAPNAFILSFVGDTHVQPSYRELKQVASAGTLSATAVHRHVEERRGLPYSNCVENTDTLNSSLVAELAFRNQSYRQVICFVLRPFHLAQLAHSSSIQLSF